MKQLFSFLFLTAFIFVSEAQGTIVGFTMSPVAPTNIDTVYIYADLEFSSGSCDLDYQSHAVTGFDILANTHHCLGLLDYVCTRVDTFKINPLPDGDYSFNLNLTSGMAPAPCTPGIVADDDSTFNFTVGPLDPSGLTNESASPFNIYPNPVQNEINLPSVSDGTSYKLIAVSGQIVKSGLVKNNVISNLDVLPSGIYFLKIEMPFEVVVKQITKK